MYLRDILYHKMVLDSAKIAVVTHKTVKKIMDTTEKRLMQNNSKLKRTDVHKWEIL